MHLRLVGALCVLINQSPENLEEKLPIIVSYNVLPQTENVQIPRPSKRAGTLNNYAKHCTSSSRFSRRTKNDLITRHSGAKPCHAFHAGKTIHPHTLHSAGLRTLQSSERSHSQQMMENARNKRHYRVVLVSLLAFVGIYVLCFTPRFATRVLLELEALMPNAISPEYLFLLERVSDFCQPVYSLLAFLVHVALSRRFRHDLCALTARTRARAMHFPRGFLAHLRNLTTSKYKPERVSDSNSCIRRVFRVCFPGTRATARQDKRKRRHSPDSTSMRISDLRRRYAFIRRAAGVDRTEYATASIKTRVQRRLQVARRFVISLVNRASLLQTNRLPNDHWAQNPTRPERSLGKDHGEAAFLPSRTCNRPSKVEARHASSAELADADSARVCVIYGPRN